jgi:hypothetical protein
MRCFHQSCAPGLEPIGESGPEPCICGDGGIVALEPDGFGATSVLEAIIETSLRRGLLEELEAMGLTLQWDEVTQRWQTTGCREHPWETGTRELEIETRH